MDAAETKSKALRQELETLGNHEAHLRSRINQLKQMVEERKKRVASIEELKKQEAALLELLK